MKDLVTGFRALVCFTLLTGGLYPAIVTVAANLFSSHKASGSLVTREGVTVGSDLIAQGFAGDKYFWPRPSAVKFDAAGSGATNLSPTSADFVNAVQGRQAQGLVVEMRFASGSGLDPHIGAEAARSQVPRVAGARRLSPEQRRALALLLETQIEPRQFGFLGQPRVNVLRLNVLLDETFGNQ